MEKKFFLIWVTHDGTMIDEYFNEGDVEARINELREGYPGDDYGFAIKKVIKGVEMDVVDVEVTTKCKLKEKE